VETGLILYHIASMARVSVAKTDMVQDTALPLTGADREARAASIACARAQVDAGETVSGDTVFRWLRSWGTDTELPAPEPTSRRS
jgi:predicted transcriptional regulator